MSQDNLARMECTVCKHINFFTRRNKKTLRNRLELKKFCKHCRKQAPHKETK